MTKYILLLFLQPSFKTWFLFYQSSQAFTKATSCIRILLKNVFELRIISIQQQFNIFYFKWKIVSKVRNKMMFLNY